MDARHEEAVGAELVEHLAAHARHDAHVDRHVGRIGKFDADMRDVRPDRPHAVRNHVEGAAAHAAVKKPLECRLHFGRRDPVVIGSGPILGLATDEGAVFHPGDVVRIGARKETVGAFFRIEANQRAGAHHFIAQAVVFLLRAIAPVDRIRLGKLRDLVHPSLELRMAHVIRKFRCSGNARCCGRLFHYYLFSSRQSDCYYRSDAYVTGSHCVNRKRA